MSNMAVQMNYGEPSRGMPGLLYDRANYDAVTRRNSAEDGKLFFGCGVVQGAEPGKDITLPATGATAEKFEGVVMYSANTEMDDDGAVLLRKGQILDVCQTGKMWVQLADQAEPAYGQPVYLVITGDDAGKFTPTKGHQSGGQGPLHRCGPERHCTRPVRRADLRRFNMAKYNPFDPTNGYSEEDRLALNGKCASLINQAYKNPFPGTKIRLDGADNAGIFFAKQLAHVKTKAYDKDFPELSGLKIFPQTSETDEGAAYIEYYSYEPVGFADVIANYASDLPRVDVKGTPHRAEIVNIGDSYGYNVQELRACRRNAVLGIMKSLDSARAEAARRVYDVKVNHLIWHGDEKTGIIGVLSSGNNIPIYTLQNGAAGKADWASKTADEIATDIAGILNYIDTLTQNVEHPDSWVMPNDLYTSLNLRRIDGTGESVLSYIKDHTPQIKNWEVAGELSKGNKDYNSTGKNIGLLYTKDSDKMSHEVPMAFLQHAPQDRNLEIVINCEGRDAGMMIPYPLSACLVYGL